MVCSLNRFRFWIEEAGILWLTLVAFIASLLISFPHSIIESHIRTVRLVLQLSPFVTVPQQSLYAHILRTSYHPLIRLLRKKHVPTKSITDPGLQPIQARPVVGRQSYPQSSYL